MAATPREAEVIEIEETCEKWRYRCPNGHTNWDTTNNHFWCRSCREQVDVGVDVDPEHWELLDTATGRHIPREQVRLSV